MCLSRQRAKYQFPQVVFMKSSLHEKHMMSSTDWLYDLKRCFLLIYDLKYPVFFYSLKKPVLDWKYSRNSPLPAFAYIYLAVSHEDIKFPYISDKI